MMGTGATPATLGRPHAQRLRHDLDEIRTELVQVVHELGPDGFDQALGPHLRSCKQLLQEIGTMEHLTRHWATHQELPDWEATSQSLDKESHEETLSALAAIRAETLTYLENCTENNLQTPIPIPDAWQEFFEGVSVIEPEELLRWVARHEYYHLGQLVTYSFMRAGSSGSAAPPA